VANKKVKIYERLKVNGKWADRTVPVPKLRPDETYRRSAILDSCWHVLWHRCGWLPPRLALLDEIVTVFFCGFPGSRFASIQAVKFLVDWLPLRLRLWCRGFPVVARDNGSVVLDEQQGRSSGIEPA